MAERAEPAANAAPRIERVRLEPERPTVGQTLRAVAEASDADGDALWFQYSWTIEGRPVALTGPELGLDGVSKDDEIEVRVVASDGKDESAGRSAGVRVANSPPRLVQVEIAPARQIVAGTPIVVRPEARDEDGDLVSFRYEWTVNGRRVPQAGAALPSDELRRGDTAVVTVVATDGEDESEPFAAPEVSVVNSPPRIVSKPGETSEDGAFRYRVVAEDPDGGAGLQYHLEKAPEGMTIDNLRGEIAWRPRPDQIGSHSVSVTVDDLQGGRSQQSFEVTVGDPDAVPAALAD